MTEQGGGASVGFERGTVYGDAMVHAIKPSLYASRALCGAGLIAGRIPGRFEPGADGSCPECAQSTAPAPPPTG